MNQGYFEMFYPKSCGRILRFKKRLISVSYWPLVAGVVHCCAAAGWVCPSLPGWTVAFGAELPELPPECLSPSSSSPSSASSQPVGKTTIPDQQQDGLTVGNIGSTHWECTGEADLWLTSWLCCRVKRSRSSMNLLMSWFLLSSASLAWPISSSFSSSHFPRASPNSAGHRRFFLFRISKDLSISYSWPIRMDSDTYESMFYLQALFSLCSFLFGCLDVIWLDVDRLVVSTILLQKPFF